MTATEPKWLAAARKDLGLREIVGSKDEPRIVAFFAAAGHPYVKDDETAWCAAFVNAKLAEVGIKGTGALNARSFLTWGQPLKKPAPGCIVVFKRGSSTWEGHVAFYLADAGAKVRVLGGNQSNAVSEALYDKANVLGYFWPLGYALPVAGPAKPAAAGRPTLQIGSRGEAVKDWQRGLNVYAGTPVLAADGEFGPKTRSTTINFQLHRQLPPDGAVNDADWNSLDLALEALG